MFKKLLVLFVAGVFALSAKPGVSFAQDRTAWGHVWAKCAARKKPVHMVWIPGIFPQCLWGYPLDAKTKQRSINLCSKFAPRIVRGKIKCVVAAKNGRIVDKRLASAIRSNPRIPVNITIFDKATGKTQKARGSLREKKGPSLKKIEADLYAGSAKICSGTYSVKLGGNAVYKGTCFGEKFSGRAKLKKLVRTSIGHTVTPESMKMTSKGSFIEVRF